MASGGTDEQEFSTYFAARYDRVRRVAYLLSGDWYRADDLAQSAFVRLARSWHSVRAKATLDAYVRTCLFREAVDESRRPWRRERTVTVVPERPSAAGVADDVTERITLAAALQRVPPRQRAVLVCRFYEDLDVAATAELLGCSAGTVKSQTARALDTLRAALADAKPHTDPGQHQVRTER